ncbi:hypothetical protein ACXYUI_33835, partial [Klebsiella pneumoniae]
IEAIMHAINCGLAQINLSIGRDVSKTRWSPETVVYRCGIERGSTLRNRVLGDMFLQNLLKRHAPAQTVPST